MAALKVKTVIEMKLGQDPLFDVCPLCGRKVEHLWEPTLFEDDSSPMRMCRHCDTAWIWPYPWLKRTGDAGGKR